MRDEVRLGTVAGFPVALNWSVLVIVLLLAWGLAEGVLPETAAGHAAATYWAAGVVGALLLICSLLAHELAHAIVARRAGVEVEGLTLWVFGGVARLRGEPPTPRADFMIAVVGPATSLVLALVFGTASLLAAVAGLPDLLIGVAAWLAYVNVVLAVFNLVPGAPLDGGRILRAALWRRSGDRDKAGATATSVGQAVAYGLVMLGLMAFLLGDAVGGLWLIFIGWFLLTAARAEHAVSTAEHVLRGISVAEVMSTPVQVGDADLRVTDFIDRHVLSGRHSAYPVVDAGGAVVGLVTLARLRTLAPAQRGTTRARDVALPLEHLVTASPGEPLAGVLARLDRESGGRALVFDQGRLVGIVTPVDVARALETRALVAQDGG
ncbi:site-2 protease family protein [Nocardioides sediminis]|uniref:site-2 protease family protein n=1 Tax=Nocardioides sediminis TaxID=433648 RepID=UPI000D30072A|nr:site-2 protease family protein [Nocardioides sediminis]